MDTNRRIFFAILLIILAAFTTSRISSKTLEPIGNEEGDAFLPIIMKLWPLPPTATPTPKLAAVYVDNDTGGQLCYEVLNTGIGENCFPSGEHYYGSFTPGSYSWKASARCGSTSGTKTFSSGEYTHRFWCIANMELKPDP